MNHRCVNDSDITVKCVVLIAYKRQMIGFFGMVFSIYICFANQKFHRVAGYMDMDSCVHSYTPAMPTPFPTLPIFGGASTEKIK